MLIDDFARPDLRSARGTPWRAITDDVMGGLSRAGLASAIHAGRRCLHLTGEVRLDNHGGFLQAALDFDPHGAPIDAHACRGVRLVVQGNGERYAVHLRTADCVRPWQSYRAAFDTTPDWRELRLPFDAFAAHRLDAPFDPSHLRRIGLVAIGRAFTADLRVAELALDE